MAPQIGAFALALRHDYEDRSAGVQLRYEGPDSLEADVFVYPGPDFAADCPQECAARGMAMEVDSFRAGFEDMVSRGYMERIELANDESLVAPAGAVWRLGRHLRLGVTRDGVKQRSDLYLFYSPGYRVKVRATYVETPQRARAIAAFVTEAVAALARGVEPPIRHSSRPASRPDRFAGPAAAAAAQR